MAHIVIGGAKTCLDVIHLALVIFSQDEGLIWLPEASFFSLIENREPKCGQTTWLTLQPFKFPCQGHSGAGKLESRCLVGSWQNVHRDKQRPRLPAKGHGGLWKNSCIFLRRHCCPRFQRPDSCLHPERRRLLFNDFLEKTADCNNKPPPGPWCAVIKIGFHGEEGEGVVSLCLNMPGKAKGHRACTDKHVGGVPILLENSDVQMQVTFVHLLLLFLSVRHQAPLDSGHHNKT